MEQLSRNRIDMMNVGLIFLAGFIVGIALAYVLFGMQTASGFQTEFALTVETAQNATNLTEGNMINSYVDSIKADICPTLGNNQTAVEECMNL